MEFGAGFGVARMAVEQPLRRIVGIGFRQAVWVFLGGDFLPMGEGERDRKHRTYCNCSLLITLAYGVRVLSGGDKCPDRGGIYQICWYYGSRRFFMNLAGL